MQQPGIRAAARFSALYSGKAETAEKPSYPQLCSLTPH